MDLAPLPEVIRDQNRRLEELSAAAAFWQVRAQQAEEQLKALTAGDDVPSAAPAAQGTGSADSAETVPDALRSWRRRWFGGGRE